MEKIKAFFEEFPKLIVFVAAIVAFCFVMAFIHFFKKYPAEMFAFLVLLIAIKGWPGRVILTMFNFKKMIQWNSGKYPNQLMKPADKRRIKSFD